MSLAFDVASWFQNATPLSQSVICMELLTDEQRALFVGGGCIADYDVIKPIGKGKFSVVYKAQRRRDAVAVALKKVAIFDLMDARAREKTLKEVRLVQSVSHEHIVQYIDAFLDGKELNIAFEWADAGDLKRQIRKAAERNVRLDERTIWRYFTQICAAILHMHRSRIMHRDLKPANIFLTTHGVVKVGDLGLGRHLSENTLEAHSKVGTPLYMSPEVLRGEGYDWKSDVWSLGCILYELAMLRSPFKSEGLNLYGLFQKINKGDYDPLPGVYSDHLRALVTRMITLDAARRPTMEHVWDACQARPSTASLSARNQPQNPQTPETTTSDRSHAKTETATPAREVTTPPLPTRPSSQQSDQAKNSPRPQSTEPQTTEPTSATDEEIALRHEEMVMEVLYDRLLLLSSNGVNHIPLSRRLSRHHFATPSRFVPPWTNSSHERFTELCKVARWLLQMCHDTGLDRAVPDETLPPIVHAQMLLLAAERVGVEASAIGGINAASLTTGCGLQVCLLLNALSGKAEELTRSTRRAPTYPIDTVDTMDADEQWEVQSDDHNDSSSSHESTTSTGGQECDRDDGGCGWLDPQWLIVRQETHRSQQDCDILHTNIDAVSWRRELERIQSKLHDRWTANQASVASATSSWQTRLEQLQSLSRSVGSDRHRAVQPLEDVAILPTQQTASIAALEARLHTPFATAGSQCKDAAVQLQQRLLTAERLQRQVIALTETRANTEQETQSRIQRLDELSSRLSDSSPLTQIKTQLKQVRQESRDMYTQLQLIRSQLLGKTRRQNTQRR